MNKEDFVAEILKLSSTVNEDGGPVFSTLDFAEAMTVVNKACEICQRYFQTIEFEIGIEAFGKRQS